MPGMGSRGRAAAAPLLAVLALSVPQARSFLGGTALPALSQRPAQGGPLRGRSFAGRTTMVDRFQEPAVRDDTDGGPHQRVGYAARVPSRYVEAAGGLGEVQVKQLTLVLCFDGAERLEGGGGAGGGGRILLGMKKRGFGEGKWNGFGGKIEEGEAVEAAALRELEEEAQVQLQPGALERRGVLTFFFDGERGVMQVHLFCAEASKLIGTPRETDEMRPQWFSLDAIPYPDMWADDVHWLPLVLAGTNTEASFLYSKAQEVSGVTLHSMARPLPDLFSAPESMDEALRGLPFLVTADVVRARAEAKRFGHSVRGERVRLVPYEKEHVVRYHEWMQDEALLEATCSEPLTLEEEYEMQVKWATDADKATFMVVDEEGELIGDVNLFFYEDDEPLTAEMNVMIPKGERRRKGYASEAVRLMLAYGWHRLGARKFLAKIGDDNAPSLAMFKSLGFKHEKHSDAFKQTTLSWSPDTMERPRIEHDP